MCLPIRREYALDPDAWLFSVTQTLVTELTDYRNRPAHEARGITSEMIERRVVGQLGYAALFAMAVGEAILRPMAGAALAVAGVCVGLLVCEPEALALSLIGVAVVVSSLYQIDVGLRCLIALVKNIYRDRMQYQDLRLAVFEICD